MIKTDNLTFSYGNNNVLKGISMEAHERELLCILGPNGVGKSTLFKCILGILRGYGGSVIINGRNAEELSITEKAGMIAYIPQISRPVFSYKVSEVVMMGTVSHVSGLGHPGKKEYAAAMEALERMGIVHLANREYTMLSGGEQQLVLIARALAQGARKLIMDEPTSSLDYGNQIKVQQQLRALVNEGYSIIQSTHNPEQTYYFADRVICLLDGSIYREGKPSEIMDADLIKALYGINVEVLSSKDDRTRFFEPLNISTDI